MDVDRPAVTRWPWRAAGAVPAVFLAAFFVWPVANVIGRGLSAGAVVDVVRDGHLRDVLWFTFWQAVVSTALTVVAALPGAWTLARYRFPGRSIAWAALTVPFVLPTVVVGAAFVALLGPHGPLASLDLYPGAGAMLAAHVFFNYAVVVRTVGNALTHSDPRLEEAARVLGASRWRTFRHVSLPLVRPALVASASIVFLFTFTSFGVVLILAGPRVATLDVEIWKQMAFFLDLRTAAALALVQLAAVIACLTFYARLRTAETPGRQRTRAEVARRPTPGRERAFVAGNLVAIAAFIGTPLVLLVHRSLDTGDGLGLGFYRALGSSRRGSSLFVPPWEAIRNSLEFATVATVLALVVGGTAAALVAYRAGRTTRGLDTVLMLPLGTSAVTLGFGFLIALDRGVLDLRGSRWLIPIAHALVAIPFVVRIVVPAIRAIDPRLREAAAVLGASPARIRLEIDLPLVSRAVLVAAGFAFAVSLGEFGATVFIARPEFPTMPIAIFRFLAQPGPLNVGQAMAMSTLLMLVTGAAVMTIERFRAGSVGQF